MLSRIRLGGLRTKIIAWSFFPTAAILLAVAVVIFYAYQEVTAELVIERNRELTRLSASQFIAELREYADLLDIETRVPDIYGSDPVAQRDALEVASNRLAIFDAGVLILDTFGTVAATEPERPHISGQDWSDRTYYRQMLRSQIRGSPRSVFSDIVADGPGGAEVIIVAVPILGPQGELAGALAGMFHVGATTVSAFYGDLTKLRLGGNGSAYLVDGQGRVIYHTDPGHVGDDLSGQAVVRQVLGGARGALRTRTDQGQRIVASFAPVPGTPWGLVSEEDWAALIGPSRGYGRFLFTMLVLGVAVPTLVLAMGMRRITRPIADLTQAAQRVAEGDFGQEIASPTGDELEEMAKQFNLMSAQLQESYTHLEQRVADRTRELTLLNRVIAATTSEMESRAILHTVCRELCLAFDVPQTGIALIAGGSASPPTSLTVVAEYRAEGEPSALGAVIPVRGYPAAQYVLETHEPLSVTDVQHDPRFAPLHDLMRKQGIVSMLILPLITRGQVVGTIGVDATEPREFTEDEIALAMNIAASAAQTLDRAWTGERLRESQRTLSTLMSNLPGMAYRRRNDADWTMEFASEGCVDLTGYQPGDLVHNAKISYAQIIYPEDREQVRNAVELALQDNSPFYLVYRIVTASGEEKWVWEQGREVASTDGERIALEGFITDVSEQVEREEALRRSTQMLSLHVQQTPLAYIEWNANLEVLDWNPAAERIFGYSKHEVLHRHAYEIIVPQEVVPHVDRVWQDILNQTGGARSTNENVTKDGRRIICEWYNTPLVNGEGVVTGLASLVQDITDRVEAEKNLEEAKRAAEEASRAKSVFLANMSHELRTPLNAILGFSQLMVTDPSLTVEQRENLNIINNSGTHLLALINDVLAVSKIEAGQTTLYEQSFDLYQLLDSVRDMFRLRAAEKALWLILNRAPEVPRYVRTDEGKLRQVLANLLSNAVKFTDEGGATLRVAYEEETSRLLFEVQDTGVGIAAEDLETLFDPFVQTASGEESQEGTGLGLPISGQYVRLMGGEITVSSILEWGTVFKFDVKVELAGASEAQAEGPTQRVVGLEPNQHTYRLLVVDNRSEDRKLLVSLLSRLGSPPQGFRIREAANGLEALEIWEQWEPHLIWMDMRMPVMSGHEATKRIKATTKGQATVIVALTASAFEEDRQLILSEGCDDFVRKPFRETDIYDKLTKHLGVQFLSEEIEPSAQPTSAGELGEVTAVLREQLAAVISAGLPDTWTSELRQAASQADGELVLDLIEQIRAQHAATADALTYLVHNYRYDIIVTSIQELGE